MQTSNKWFTENAVANLIWVDVKETVPSQYRLCRRGDKYVLQGGFGWEYGHCGETQRRVEWRDLETVTEDAAQ